MHLLQTDWTFQCRDIDRWRSGDLESRPNLSIDSINRVTGLLAKELLTLFNGRSFQQ